VAVDYDCNILVTEGPSHRVSVFNETGTYITSFGSEGNGEGRFRQPQGITVDHENGAIYVVDSLNHRVQVF